MKRSMAIMAAICLAASLAAETAVIQDIRGKVEIKALGGSWKTATNGMRIDLLATISTGFDSSVVLVIADNRVAVAPLTRLTIDKILATASSLKTSLHLRVGSVSADVKSSAGTAQEFKVTSPYSTASVRGTRFTYDGLELNVREGRVAFIPGRPVRDILLPTFAPQSSGPSETPPAEAGAEGTGGAPPAEGAVPAEEAPPPEQAPAPESGVPEPSAPEGGIGDAAAFMAALEGEFGGDSFSFSDQSGQELPPPQVQAPSEGGAPVAPTSPPSPPPQQEAVFVSAGASAVLSIDYSAPANRPQTTSQGGAGIVPPQSGGDDSSGQQTTPTPVPPVITPPPAPTTGSITVQWN